ncbi:hypothetical protein [Pectobacterium aroidearum]|uniref:hypothetical protein n=1 Tax=Pectobacterium aroidearum TaxID=1201031 RepID=UPI0032EB22D3
MKLSKDIFYAGVSLGIETMRQNLPEPLKVVEQGVVHACREIGLDPEHEINGIPFVGRVIVRVMEYQFNEKLMPEDVEECSHLIVCSKVAAYADAFGADKAGEKYSLTAKEVLKICDAVQTFRDSVGSSGKSETGISH